jgi:hypothetical protein
MAGAVNTIGQSKRGGGDRSSRPAQLQSRENEQKALSLWIKGATYQQIAAAGFGIVTASGAWRVVSRALARIPKAEADLARQAARALASRVVEKVGILADLPHDSTHALVAFLRGACEGPRLRGS